MTAFESPLVSSHQHRLCVVNCRKLSPPPLGRREGALLIGLTSLRPPPPTNDHSLETSLKEVVALVAPSPEDEALLVKMIQQETTPHQSYPTLPWSWSFTCRALLPSLGPLHATTLHSPSHVAGHSACPLLPNF